MQRVKPRYFAEFLIHVLFWAMLYYALRGLTVSTYALIDRTAGSGGLVGTAPVVQPDMNTITVRTLFPYAGAVLGFLMVLFYSCAFWLFKRLIGYQSIAARLSAVAGWLILIFSADYLFVRLLISLRTDGHMARMVPDNPALLHLPDVTPLSAHWQEMQLTMALAFVAIMGIAAAYFFSRQWIQNELMRSQAVTVQLATELRYLRAQVNPHFLFNTLNNLFAMALKEGKSSLAGHIAKLSNMMRYMLYETHTDSVPLIKEIECLKDYLTLQGMRYAAGEADISFQYPDPAIIAGIQVAPMLFIPFLENAFKHGVAIGQPSHIAMSIAVSPKELIFSCENTDHSAVTKLAEETGGIGLENVKRRLELLYPGRYVLKAGAHDGNYNVNLQIELL